MSGFILFLIVFVVMLLVVLGMSAGVLAGRRPLAGSCGGIARLGIEKSCSICGGVPEKCEQTNGDSNTDKASDLAYDASK